MTNSYTSPPTIVVNFGEGSSTAPFCLDWVSDKLYYTKGYGIWESNLNGTLQTVLVKLKVEYVYKPYWIIVDPYDKKLFYSIRSALIEFNLNSKKETKICTEPELFIGSLVLDVHTQSIYMLQLPGGNFDQIMKKPVNESNLVDVLHTPNKDILYFEVIDNNNIFYIQREDGYIIVNYNNAPVKISVNWKPSYTESLAIHELIQAPTKKVVCSRMRCSHLCEYSPQTAARCVCPSGMQLDSTGRHCRHRSASRYSREESNCDDYSDCSTGNYSEDESRDDTESEDTEYYSESEDETSSNEEYHE